MFKEFPKYAFVLLIFTFVIFPERLLALAFTPSEVEWNLWPPYCRARYVVSGAGHDTAFTERVSKSEVEKWHNILHNVWYSLHHYCAGKLFLVRAKNEKDPEVRRRLFNRVIGEAICIFQIDRERSFSDRDDDHYGPSLHVPWSIQSGIPRVG